MIKVSCCIPGKLPPEAGLTATNQYEKLLFGYQYLTSIGFDTVETSVGFVLDLTDEERAKLAQDRASGRFELAACNCLLPSQHSIITDEAGWKALLAYLDDAFPKLAELGVKVVVCGSGRARSTPEGRSETECDAIRRDFLVYCNGLCEKYGITMVLEPLNKGETNWVNTVAEGAAVVRELNLPHIRLLADGFHMAKEGEDPSVLREVGDVLVHTHFAKLTHRHAPYTYDSDYEDRFFSALKEMGYNGIMTCECGYRSFHEDAANAAKRIKEVVR